MQKLNAILALLIVIQVAGQEKPLINTSMLGNWPRIVSYNNSVVLSKDGNYVAYIIQNLPVGKATLTMQDLRGNWKKTITIGSNDRILFFSADSRKVCWQQGDSIWLQQAGKHESHLLGVSENITYPREAQGLWVAIPGAKDSSFRLINLLSGKVLTFQGVVKHTWAPDGRNVLLATADGSLKWLNLVTSKKLLFEGIKDYALSHNGESLLLMTEKGGARALQWIDGESGRQDTIWRGQSGELPGGYVYDKTAEQMAFYVRSAEGKLAIWYYKQGTGSAQLRANDSSTGFAADLRIAAVNSFSDNGRWLFFTVRKNLSPLPAEKVVTAVDIWSYRDEILNPAETRGVKTFHDYTAALDIPGKSIRLLEQQEDESISAGAGNFLLLRKGGNNVLWGYWWPHSEPESIWLVCLENGKRKLIRQSQGRYTNTIVAWSPNGRWLYYWDPAQRNYFIVDPKTGNRLNLTVSVPFPLEDDMTQGVVPLPVGLVGWSPGDSLIWVYDNYDIWQLDPSGTRMPVNVTGGYGRQQGTKLRLVNDRKEIFQPDEELLLWGLNDQTKHNGFFRLRLDIPGVPDLLTMGPYCYFIMMPDSYTSLVPLVGGEGKNKRWIVMRENDTEFPNLFVSKDLKKFTALSNLQPQKEYNWLTAESVRWRMYNGQHSTGILYKPENFDVTKKYPVIFNYYEKLSHRCFQFPMPGLTRHNINIPWFVSRGYLVFIPDIQYAVASKPGGMTISEAAYNAVASAAEHLGLRAYVDKNRMAIQGHSFGGQETVGIIAQTGMFSAAAEMAGTVDQISSYLTLVASYDHEDSIEKHHKQDHPQGRMGVTPWEQPDLYRRNSAILHADKITTPLMIVHNKKDGAINFRQGVEMYMAMRRLGKPCWLLQYDNSGHVLESNDALDYTIRLTQYFDHYLKEMPAPQWMTGNTLASCKGRNNLYGLDPDGNCCKNCKVCEKWNK